MMHRPSLSLANRVLDLEGTQYRVVELIGDGSYADVYKVQRLNDNNFFALKKMRVLRGNQSAENHLKNECYAASKLGQHQNIVRLFEKSEHALQGGNPGDKEVFMLYELCQGGNLFNLIQNRTNQGAKGLPESEVILIAANIVQGLAHMHTQQPPIAHRDIKPENVLLGGDNKWKLCDFGSSSTKTYQEINSENRWQIEDEIKRQTTRLYQAPEQIDLYSSFPITEKVDIFALGCLIFTLLFFRSPFDADMGLEHSNARYVIPTNVHVSNGMRNLLAKTLAQDPRQRISSTELWSQLEHLQQISLQQQHSTKPPSMLSEAIQSMPGYSERRNDRTPTRSTNQAQNPIDFTDHTRVAGTDRNNARIRNQRSNSVGINQRHPQHQPQANPVLVNQAYGLANVNQQNNNQMVNIRNQNSAMGHNYSQSVLVQAQSNNAANNNIQVAQPNMPQQNFAPARQQQQTINLNYPSPLDQTKTNIKNWVNHYCEMGKKAPSELAFRNLVEVLIPQQEFAHAFMVSINQLNFDLVVIALKAMILIHRQMLYCPRINPVPYEKLFNREHQRWTQIEKMQQGHNADFYRTPLMVKLVYKYIELLQAKVSLVKEYGTVLNSAYVLQPKTIGENNSSSVSPLAKNFVVRVTQLFDKFNTLHGSLFNDRQQLFEVRLSLTVNLIEDQFLLMSLLTHLNFACKVMYRIKQGSMGNNQNSQNLDDVAQFIGHFDNAFQRCLNNYETLIGNVRKINDLANLRNSLPIIPTNLTATLSTLAEAETRRLWQSTSPFQELLNVHNQREGLYLPVIFQSYPNYLTNCNYDCEVIIGNPRYRQALDQKLANDYFNNPPRPPTANPMTVTKPPNQQQALQQMSISQQLPPPPQSMVKQQNSMPVNPQAAAMAMMMTSGGQSQQMVQAPNPMQQNAPQQFVAPQQPPMMPQGAQPQQAWMQQQCQQNTPGMTPQQQQQMMLQQQQQMLLQQQQQLQQQQPQNQMNMMVTPQGGVPPTMPPQAISSNMLNMGMVQQAVVAPQPQLSPRQPMQKPIVQQAAMQQPALLSPSEPSIIASASRQEEHEQMLALMDPIDQKQQEHDKSPNEDERGNQQIPSAANPEAVAVGADSSIQRNPGQSSNLPDLGKLNLRGRSSSASRQSAEQNSRTEEIIKQLQQRNLKAGMQTNQPLAASEFASRLGGNKVGMKKIRLKKSPNNKLLPPKGNNMASKTGGQVDLGNMLKPVDQAGTERVHGQQNLGQMVSAGNLSAQNNSPKMAQSERIGAELDHEALATNKRAIVTEISGTVEQDQDVEALCAQDVEVIKNQTVAEDCPPDHMYTHPASESNFKYDQVAMKSGQPAANSNQNKYQGDPKKDLAVDLQDQVGLLSDDQRLEMTHNQDMQAMFDQSLEPRSAQQLNDNKQTTGASSLELKQKMNLLLDEQERMTIVQQKKEVRISIDLERLRHEKQSQAQIQAKERELEELRQKHRSDDQVMQGLRQELQEKINNELIFEQQKQKAREYMLKQQQENLKLKEENERILREYQELQRAHSEQQSQQSQSNRPVGGNNNSFQQNDPTQVTQTQQASDILDMEFQKGTDYFRIDINDIHFEKQIGAGASADVFKATYKENDVAVKKLKFANNGQDTGKNNLTKEFKREIATLIKVRHTNLVNFMGACTDATSGQVLILTEFCFGGTLFSLLHEKRSIELSMRQRFRMAFDIAKGMNFLHIQEPQILHRDLKSLNLLMVEEVKSPNDYVQVKVTDFGLSRSIQEMNTTMQPAAGMMTGLAGTFHWMAPEVLQSDTNYSHKADVYSFAIVMWEIMSREPPFKGLRPHEIMAQVVQMNTRPNLQRIPQNCPPQYRQIMERCWDSDPLNRPDFSVIVKMLKTIENLFV